MLVRIIDLVFTAHRVWIRRDQSAHRWISAEFFKERARKSTNLKLESKRKMPSHLRWGPRYRFCFLFSTSQLWKPSDGERMCDRKTRIFNFSPFYHLFRMCYMWTRILIFFAVGLTQICVIEISDAAEDEPVCGERVAMAAHTHAATILSAVPRFSLSFFFSVEIFCLENDRKKNFEKCSNGRANRKNLGTF